MSDLEISDDAIYAGEEIVAEAYVAPVRQDAEVVAEWVLRAGAPLIVAAELRSLLAELESGRYGSTSAMVACVRRRIGALDKQGGQQ